MTVRPPTKEMLQMLAGMNNFELSGKELEDFHEIISDLIKDFHKVEQMPSNLPVPREGIRRSGNRPSRDEDPFNAIVRRCRVTGAASGRLAGRKVGVKDNVCVAGIPDDLRLPGDEGVCARHGRNGGDAAAGRGRRNNRRAEHGRLRLLRRGRHQRLRAHAESPQQPGIWREALRAGPPPRSSMTTST